MSTALPTPLLLLLAQLVETEAGLHYRESDLDLFAERVGTRAAEAGFESVLDYYYFLRYDDAKKTEIERLVDQLVVGETYFFREAAPLATLVETLREGMLAGKRARIWSAACSTGEEAVTLRIMLARAGLEERVDVVATDISARALERAQRGDYGLRALRAIPEGASPWIEVQSGRAQVMESVRASIEWKRVNLTDEAEVAALGVFDAIVCRNVLIYFSDETVKNVADHLARALKPGGRLLVGASESLLRFGTVLECEERGGSFFYKRRST